MLTKRNLILPPFLDLLLQCRLVTELNPVTQTFSLIGLLLQHLERVIFYYYLCCINYTLINLEWLLWYQCIPTWTWVSVRWLTSMEKCSHSYFSLCLRPTNTDTLQLVITPHSDRVAWRQETKQMLLFQFSVSWSPRVLLRCIAINRCSSLIIYLI
jgi:hypothetical protein